MNGTTSERTAFENAYDEICLPLSDMATSRVIVPMICCACGTATCQPAATSYFNIPLWAVEGNQQVTKADITLTGYLCEPCKGTGKTIGTFMRCSKQFRRLSPDTQSECVVVQLANPNLADIWMEKATENNRCCLEVVENQSQKGELTQYQRALLGTFHGPTRCHFDRSAENWVDPLPDTATSLDVDYASKIFGSIVVSVIGLGALLFGGGSGEAIFAGLAFLVVGIGIGISTASAKRKNA